MQSRLVQSIALFLMGVCVLPQARSQTPPTLPAPRAAPLPAPAQRIEAAQNLSNTEADSALAQLNAYRKAMGLSVLVKNAPLTAAAMRHSLYRSVILADNKEAENFDVNGTPGSHFQMIPNPYFTGKTKPPLALVKLFKLLDRHPDLLNEVRLT